MRFTAKELGDALRQLREKRGLESVDVAKRAKIGQATITKTERGDQFPVTGSLFKWLAALDTTPAAFFSYMEAEKSEDEVLRVVTGFEHYYKLLTGIIESGNHYFIKAIEGNLYGMLAAAGRPLPPSVPEPPIEATDERSTKQPKKHRRFA